MASIFKAVSFNAVIISKLRASGHLYPGRKTLRGTYEMDSHQTSWDVWSHRYDLMGLLRYYEISGFKPALSASEKIGDLLIKTFGMEKGQKTS